jgi:type 1 glutamine amidotransferase
VLVLAGNEAHKWHNWVKTTAAMQAFLPRDPRIRIEVAHDFEALAQKDLRQVDVIVQNYANWLDPRLPSDAARAAFVRFVDQGGGLIVIHFACGAFHFSLPKAGASDWPDYRKIVRRVWNHQAKSGHDRFGRFLVEVTPVDHLITRGLHRFEVTDELYFRQDGDQPIEPLLTARSTVTGKEEPLAWAAPYGKGRVFQILLGHSEKTYETYEVREILRRAVAWAAGRDVRTVKRASDSATDRGKGTHK